MARSAEMAGGEGAQQDRSRLLLIDTCGPHGSIALAEAGSVLRQQTLPERSASAALLLTLKGLLEAVRWELRELTGVGVVNGPGSFTGLRAGLAAAKGLCEAASLPLWGVSRLAVLAHAGKLNDGFAVLYAGRGQVYVREVRNGDALRETLANTDDLIMYAGGRSFVFSEPQLRPLLASLPAAREVAIDAGDALPLVHALLASPGSGVEFLDANYVRDEQLLYAKAVGQV